MLFLLLTFILISLFYSKLMSHFNLHLIVLLNNFYLLHILIVFYIDILYTILFSSLRGDITKQIYKFIT